MIKTFQKDKISDFQLMKRIGLGAFGEVFLSQLDKKKVAVKISFLKKYLKNQIEAYKLLIHEDFTGLPKIGPHGEEGDFTFFVMQALGPDLQKLLRQFKRLSLKSVLMFAQQGISRLKFLHSKGIVHRDVKPQNFCVGSPQAKQSHRFYLIDLGLSKIIKSGEDKGGIFGTPIFMSVNAMSGKPQSISDDLQSFVYNLFYLLEGSLPWQDMANKTEQQLKKMRIFKQKCQIFGRRSNVPELLQSLKIARECKSEQIYQLLRLKLRSCMQRIGQKYDYIFEWNKREESKLDQPLSKKARQLKIDTIAEEEKAVFNFLQNMSIATIEPTAGKGSLVQPKVKKLPDPREFYLKRTAQEQRRESGPRIALNKQPYSKHK